MRSIKNVLLSLGWVFFFGMLVFLYFALSQASAPPYSAGRFIGIEIEYSTSGWALSEIDPTNSNRLVFSSYFPERTLVEVERIDESLDLQDIHEFGVEQENLLPIKKLSLIPVAHAMPTPPTLRVNNLTTTEVAGKTFYQYAYKDWDGQRIDAFLLETADKESYFKIKFFNRSKGFMKHFLKHFEERPPEERKINSNILF